MSILDHGFKQQSHEEKTDTHQAGSGFEPTTQVLETKASQRSWNTLIPDRINGALFDEPVDYTSLPGITFGISKADKLFTFFISTINVQIVL